MRLRLSVIGLLAGAAMAVVLAACTATGGPGQADLPLTDEAQIGKFVWHDLITDDVAVAKQFYSGLFGWRYEDTTRDNGQAYTLIISGGYYIGGMVQLADPENIEYSRWLGYLSVADVDAAAATTSATGGEVVVEPLDVGSIARAAAVTDPQGAVVGLIRSSAGDPLDGFQEQPGHVIWNELLAADDSSAADFYHSLAGYEVDARQRRGGTYYVLGNAGVERAGVMQRPSDDVEPVWLTYFAVSDPVRSADQTLELGGQVLLAPSPELRESSMALITDPGGAVLALQRWPN